MGFEGRLSGVCRLELIWAIFRSGVTGGVTKWGYIFEKVGLQISGLEVQ